MKKQNYKTINLLGPQGAKTLKEALDIVKQEFEGQPIKNMEQIKFWEETIAQIFKEHKGTATVTLIHSVSFLKIQFEEGERHGMWERTWDGITDTTYYKKGEKIAQYRDAMVTTHATITKRLDI